MPGTREVSVRQCLFIAFFTASRRGHLPELRLKDWAESQLSSGALIEQASFEMRFELGLGKCFISVGNTDTSNCSQNAGTLRGQGAWPH